MMSTPTLSTTDSKQVSSRSETLLVPTKSIQNVSIEYSIHTLPRSFKRELSSVFPSHKITATSEILLVPTMQKSSIDLMAYGERQEKEKDRLLEAFFEWSTLVRQAIRKRIRDAWVDVTDPASGVARWGARGSVYSDVDGFSRILKYPTVDVGCTIVRHPHWGFACYPATLFTDAPFVVVRDALKQVSGA